MKASRVIFIKAVSFKDGGSLAKRRALVKDKKAPGFILIELLVSLFIASMLSVGIMNSLTMVFKTNEVMDSLMDTSSGGLRLQQQIERDLSGVTIPASLLATATGAETQSTQQPSAPGQQPAVPGSPKTVESYKNKHLFFATQKDKNTDVLTFITTNPLASFWSDTAGQAQSRLVRVVYRLEPDKENPPYFKLMRQEGMDFDFKNYGSGAKKQIRQLEVARNIKNFSMKFMVEDKPEEKEKPADKNKATDKNKPVVAQDESAKKKTITYKVLDDWRIEENSDAAARKKMAKIPRFVQLSLTLMDAKKIKEATFDYIFSIPCDEEPFAKKEKSQNQGAQQSPQPGGIRARIQASAGKPKTMPGGLLGQFTQSLVVRA